MSQMLLFRLVLDGIALALLLVGLAYWWLDNTTHEIVGTAMFGLIILHNFFNRRVYSGLPRGRYDLNRRTNLAVILSLLVTMLVLLVTSVMISRDLFGFLSIDGSYTVREIHKLSAYWVLLILALHIGTRWSVVMNAMHVAFGISNTSRIRIFALRMAAALIALYGLQNSFEMAFGSKLILRYTLDMWDFNDSTWGFFLNYLSIIGLHSAIGHYAMMWIRSRKNIASVSLGRVE